MITEDAGNLGFDQERLAHIGDVINKDVLDKTYDGAVIAISRGGQTARCVLSGLPIGPMVEK